MFVSSKALVLHKTKYGDSGIVVKFFTEKYGTQTFIIKSAFSPKNRHENQPVDVPQGGNLLSAVRQHPL